MLNSEVMEGMQVVETVQMYIITLGEFFYSPEWLGYLEIWAGVEVHMGYRKHNTIFLYMYFEFKREKKVHW